jgi:hypothetical protein
MLPTASRITLTFDALQRSTWINRLAETVQPVRDAQFLKACLVQTAELSGILNLE